MIFLDEKLVFQMKLQAEKSYPDECCGFIFGQIENDSKTAEFIKPAENTSDEGFHRFLITPEQMLKAEMYASQRGVDIIGFYHSHPDCKATPSEYDRSHALPVYSYIIVSSVKGKAEDFFSWQLDKNSDYKKFTKEEIRYKGE